MNSVRHYWYIEPSRENIANIVLLRLRETLTFNPNIQPIRLPSNENFSYEAWSTHILGFQTPVGSFSAQLQSVHTSVFNNSLCNFSDYIADHEICGNEGSDINGSGPIKIFDAFTGNTFLQKIRVVLTFAFN